MALTPGGTVATYQGWHCLALEVVRSAGFEPDVSTALVYAQDFDNLRFDLPTEPVPGTTIGSVDRPVRVGPDGQALELEGFAPEGTILLREEISGEGPGAYLGRLEGFHLVSARKVDLSRPNGVVLLTLTDDRAFWRRGRLPRRRFNIRDDQGRLFRDTLDDGENFTVFGLVDAIAAELFGRPTVARVPSRWRELPASFEFEPGTDPRSALEQVLDRFKARIVLHWDRSLGFYLHGETQVAGLEIGYTAGGELASAGGNTLPIATSFRQAGLSETGRSLERPPEFAVVMGGERVQTVRVLCEPVVEVNTEPRPLEVGLAEVIVEDAERRAALRGRQGLRVEDTGAGPGVAPATPQEGEPNRITPNTLQFVQEIVLRPESYRGSPVGSFERVTARDGYQVWRVVGADSFNKGLFPVQDRSEAKDGSRLPPLLQAHRWVKRQGEVRLIGGSLGSTTSGVEAVDPRRRRQEIDRARLAANARLTRARNTIYSVRLRPLDPTDEPVVGPAPRPETGEADVRTPREQVASRLARARRAIELLARRFLDRGGLARIGPQFVPPEGIVSERFGFDVISMTEVARDGLGQLEPELVAEVALEDPGVRDVLKSRLRSALEEFRAARDDRNKVDPFKADALEFGRAMDAIGEAIREGNRRPTELVDAALRQARTVVQNQRERLRQTFAERTAELLPQASYFSNERLQNDPTATIESDRLGTFRSSGAVGHLRDEDLPKDTLLGSRLVPMPVYAVFGTRITRPALERETLAAAVAAAAIVQAAVGSIEAALDVTVTDERSQLERDRAVARVVQSDRDPVSLARSLGIDLVAPSPKLTDAAGQPVDVAELTDEEIENVVFAFRRDGSNVVEIKLGDVPVGSETVIRRPELVELIQLDGQTNREQLRQEALVAAREELLRVRQLSSSTVVYTRPWRVNPNGVVARVTIRLREQAAGFQTVVELGTETQPERRGASTFVPRRRVPPAERGDQTR